VKQKCSRFSIKVVEFIRSIEMCMVIYVCVQNARLHLRSPSIDHKSWRLYRREKKTKAIMAPRASPAVLISSKRESPQARGQKRNTERNQTIIQNVTKQAKTSNQISEI
jgi:hypothetical protein